MWLSKTQQLKIRDTSFLLFNTIFSNKNVSFVKLLANKFTPLTHKLCVIQFINNFNKKEFLKLTFLIKNLQFEFIVSVFSKK